MASSEVDGTRLELNFILINWTQAAGTTIEEQTVGHRISGRGEILHSWWPQLRQFSCVPLKASSFPSITFQVHPSRLCCLLIARAVDVFTRLCLLHHAELGLRVLSAPCLCDAGNKTHVA